jgi:hypothetical protein
MVTKGYQKGVYERVTKGTGRKHRRRNRSVGILPAVPRASSPSAAGEGARRTAAETAALLFGGGLI